MDTSQSTTMDQQQAQLKLQQQQQQQQQQQVQSGDAQISSESGSSAGSPTSSASSLPQADKYRDSALVAPFETILGVTDGGVEVYSCDYATADKKQHPTRDSYQSFVDGVFTGYKWQCVELARRYLLQNQGVIFDSIPMAYDIFNLRSVTRVSDNERLEMVSLPNGSKTLPTKGSLLIWGPMGEFKVTGHVAVIVRVDPTFVDIVEQNVEDRVWPEDQDYSRRLPATLNATNGEYRIACAYDDASILGWMNIMDTTLSDKVETTRACMQRHVFQVPQCATNFDWMDKSDPAVKVWSETQGRHLIEAGGRNALYFTFTEHGLHSMEQAVRELRLMFINATDYVIHHQNEDFIKHFRVPEKLWPKIRKSWLNRQQDTVSGRLDLCLTETGLKCFEYNADSASCLMECGYVQDAWAKAAGLSTVGHDISTNVLADLIKTWRSHRVDGTLHMLYDCGDEEEYHTLYMKKAVDAAGIKSKVVCGLSTLGFNSYGEIVDEDGTVVRNVWKTWSWSTAINQLRESEFEDWLTMTSQMELNGTKSDADAELSSPAPQRASQAKPKLVDVLLHPRIRVFEPLWTLIPASKAILPVLCKLYPGHPFLLQSSFTITPEMEANGYVAKPVTGRGGSNVVLYDRRGSVLSQKEGKWSNDSYIYQELCLLPKYGDDNVQVNCFTTRHKYLGTVLRVDKNNIIDMDSEVYPLRVVKE